MVLDIQKITFDLGGNVAEGEPDETWADDFLRALGYLLVQSNILEDALKDLYWIVTQKPWTEVHDDLRGLTLGRLCDEVVKAFEARFQAGEHRDRLERFKPELAGAVQVRNQFVHASWVFDHARSEMEHRRLPKQAGALEELRRMTVRDVEAAIETVGGVAERVWSELYDSISEEAPHPNPGAVSIRRL